MRDCSALQGGEATHTCTDESDSVMDHAIRRGALSKSTRATARLADEMPAGSAPAEITLARDCRRVLKSLT